MQVQNFPNAYDLLGFMFAQCLAKGAPEGAGPLDAADFMGDIAEAVCRMNSPDGYFRITIEPEDHTGEFTDGHVLSNVCDAYGVNGRSLQCFCPMGRVTIAPLGPNDR
jgi:hypothetical protein